MSARVPATAYEALAAFVATVGPRALEKQAAGGAQDSEKKTPARHPAPAAATDYNGAARRGGSHA